VALGQSTPTGFSLIPGGSFTMGRTSGDTDADAPPVTVTVSPFYLQQTETTKAQWDEVRTWAVSNGYTDLAAGAGKAANHPVQSVSWWDVVKWCNARSEKEGLTPVYTVSGAVMRTGTTAPTANWSANGYRLPTEAEWEKAARGGVSGKRFPWGTDTISHAEANFRNNGGEVYATGTTGDHPLYAAGEVPYTSPVGSFGANGYGLYDMAGNLFEWCWDWYAASSYTTSNGTTDPRGLASGSSRVRRGGTFQHYAIDCRASLRSHIAPFNRSTDNGFRLARGYVISGFSYIPGGSFTMGRTSGDTDSNAPPITVTVSPFYIQQTETTKAQWDEIRAWGLNNGYSDLATGGGKLANHPVHSVSWHDVVKWCNARSEKEGLIPIYAVSGGVMRSGTSEPTANWSANGYRLPTEAEWEKAARGGASGWRYPWRSDTISHAEANYYASGTGYGNLNGIIGFHPSYATGTRPYTSPVGSFAANGYGLYDMIGNVWEWCWDWYDSAYYSTSNGTTNPRGAVSGPGRVDRGDGWDAGAFYARLSWRNHNPPATAWDNKGFRPARNIVPLIDSHPLPLTVSRDDSATFSVAATGNGTLTYQWQKDGVDIPGATSSSFVVSNVQSSNVGFYRCVITDNFGDAFTNEASLRIFGLPLFRVMQNTLHWHQAKADAVSNGGRLAVLETQEKLDHLNDWLQSINNSRYLWIGLTDEDSEGSWKWIDGTPLEAFHWAIGEPNNNEMGEDYVHILDVGNLSRWNDLPSNWWIYTPGGYVLEVSSSPPTLSPPSSTQISATTATLGGNVTSDGGATIAERGVVYSATATSSDPLLGGTGVTKVTATGITGVFTIPVTGLTPGINYSYKAYATNSQGTTYTSVATFTTLSNNADLSALTLSNGTLSPTFASSTTAYTASVPNATSSITATPTRAQANATIEVRVNTGTYAAVTSGSPSASLPLNVGTNTVDVRVTAEDGTTRKTYTVTVTRDKAAQTITFANPGAQLANATVNLSATGGASGNPVAFTVEGPATLAVGKALSFTGAGSVTVRANQAGNDLYHPAPEVAQTFTVSKATATVTLGNLAQIYDGTPRPVSATTNPSGKTVALTYDNSPTPPTDAGFYIVAGTINDPIYQGSSSRILVIAKAAQTITFAAIPDKLTTDTIALSATGGGSGNAVTYAVTSGPASITEGVLSFTGAGSVTITASQAGNANYEAASTVSRTFTVTKATATVTLGNLSQTYDGTPKSATATTDPAGKTVILTYEGGATAPTNAGSYVVVGTINDPMYQGSATGTLQIAKATQTITFAAIPDKLATDTVTLSATGGGSGNPVTFAVTEGPATISSGVLSFTGAGNVTVAASQTGNANYEAASTVSRTFAVTKANATVTLDNLAQTYDGTPKSATAATDPAGKSVIFTYGGSATAPTNSGSYEVVGTINDPIYQGNASGTLEITKAAQAITFAAIPDKLTTDSVTLSATGGGSGNAVTFAVTEGPATISNGVLSFTGAGSVTITASQTGNANYEAAATVSRSFTVTKASATVTLGNLSQIFDGTPKTASATTDPVGKTVSFTYEGSSTAPSNAGSYAVVATLDDPIYQGSANGTLTIAKAAQTITFANPGPQLANAPMNLSATGGGSGNAVTFAVTSGPASISNGVLSFSGPGDVTITASQAGNANYESATPVSRTFTVSKAAATVTLSRLRQVADGTAREVVVTTVPADLEIEVTYDGTANAPVVPGSYAVVATSADDRYEGSASGTLVVDDPARSVRVPGGSLSALGDLAMPTFSIGAYEVTGSQWSTVVTWAEANAGYDFAGAGVAASGDRPVTGINWFDAAKWCNARTEWENAVLSRSLAPAYRVAGVVYKTGAPTSPAELTCDFSAGGYRLPTAAEWEYAARGGAFGTPATYPGGNTLDELGWYVANSNGATQPAGGKTANGLGLYDLAGNAAEWTWDAPTGSPGRRLLQGGAWSSAPSACELGALAAETASARLDRSGFRVARSISLALAAALDAPDLAWESGGDEAWSAQTTPSHDGIDSAESGAVAPGQSSWLETTVSGPCNLRFRWEASQRQSLDVFRLETRTGDPILLTGAANWSERLVELPSGDHTLRWLFVRDAASTGISRVRLDAVSVTPATTPSVTTAAAASISGSGATLGGNVTADGGRTVTARGVVYSTTPDPTLTSPGSLAAASGGTGTFSVVAAGLAAGTTYHARAYATNTLGSSYGENVVFTTDTTVPLTEGLGTVTGRTLLAGDTQRFRFSLAFPSDAAFTTTGLDAATWELRDGGGALVDSGSGNVDFGGLLLSGQYLLSLTSTGGTTQTFSLDLDASLEAVPKPDLSIGSDPTAAPGVGV
jgi:formylglycine-generating enzyme required for sulfatase activity